jgi:hypothetical protein
MVSGPDRNALVPLPAFSSTATVPELVVHESSADWMRLVSGGLLSWLELAVRLDIDRVAVRDAHTVDGTEGSRTFRLSPVIAELTSPCDPPPLEGLVLLAEGVGLDEGVLDDVGLGEGLLDGGALVAVAPVHVVPLRAKLAGTGLLLVHDPLKPKSALPLVARAAL